MHWIEYLIISCTILWNAILIDQLLCSAVKDFCIISTLSHILLTSYFIYLDIK